MVRKKKSERSWKKLLSVLMAVCLLVGVSWIPVMAAEEGVTETSENGSLELAEQIEVVEEIITEETNTVEETGASSFDKADLIISSVAGLNAFSKDVNSGNTYAGKLVKLSNDIKYDSVTINNFTPIAQYSNDGGFSGTFDGGGYTISGIDISSTEEYGGGLGLFGCVSSGGVIKNVIVKDITITKTGRNGIIGGVVGYLKGTVRNCHVNNVIIRDNTYYQRGIGVIVGNCEGGMIINCTNSYDKSTAGIYFGGSYKTYQRVGGVVGEISNGVIYNSGNSIKMSGDDSYAGGVVGYSSKTDIQNCYNVGTVSTGSGSTGGVIGYVDGGIVANNFYSSGAASQAIGLSYGNAIKRNNQALTRNMMATAAFAQMLNNNLGSNASWLKWESRSGNLGFPTHIKLYGVNFSVIQNGEVSSYLDYAYKGQLVSLTLKPFNHYKTGSVTVKTTSGATVNVSRSNGQYQFNMPDSGVVISALFVWEDWNLKDAKIATVKEQSYTGKVLKPTLSVTYKGTKLVENVDYTTSYKNNKVPGTATVTIKGRESYTGQKTTTFKIAASVKKASGLKQRQVNNSTITLKWNKVSPTNGYEIYRADSSGKNFKKIATVKKGTTTTYVDKKVSSGTIYKYRIRAFRTVDKKNHYSSYSKILTGYTQPNTVKLTSVNSTKSKQAILVWRKTPRATGYEVLRAESKDGKYRRVATVKTLKYTDKKVESNKSYYYVVRAYKSVNGVRIYGNISRARYVKVK